MSGAVRGMRAEILLKIRKPDTLKQFCNIYKIKYMSFLFYVQGQIKKVHISLRKIRCKVDKSRKNRVYYERLADKTHGKGKDEESRKALKDTESRGGWKTGASRVF